MENTGSYWQNLYVELSKHGFDVTLCNGKFTKNIKGKRPMKKCQMDTKASRRRIPRGILETFKSTQIFFARRIFGFWIKFPKEKKFAD